MPFILFVVSAVAVLLIKHILERGMGSVYYSDLCMLVRGNVLIVAAYAYGIYKFLLETIIEQNSKN